jgi:hypothetical protein
VARLTAADRERLRSINMLMDELYSMNADIYESLVDMELDECYKNVSRLIRELRRLQESLRDET